jgi:tRNA (mo5U34)-methyltransferase
VTDARAAVAANPLWYHTMEVAPGVVTPGWFDLRPVLDRLPWPDVAGKRCLDVGTYDGHLAFELERRGAAEVVATDLADHTEWDWPVRLRERGPAELARVAGPEKGEGFRIARELLGSSVERVECSVYDLSPERMGTFDVVVCGSLMLHLRDPVRALGAIRSVCSGLLLSAEEILPRLEWGPAGRRPLAELDGLSDLCQWWTPNRAGHRRMVEAAGFEVQRTSSPYCIRFGPAHPRVPLTPSRLARAARVWALTRQSGLPNVAVLAAPA